MDIPEILDHIMSYLDIPDILSLSSTCRRYRRQVDNKFWIRLASKRYFLKSNTKSAIIDWHKWELGLYPTVRILESFTTDVYRYYKVANCILKDLCRKDVCHFRDACAYYEKYYDMHRWHIEAYMFVESALEHLNITISTLCLILDLTFELVKDIHNKTISMDVFHKICPSAEKFIT